jgi:exosortase
MSTPESFRAAFGRLSRLGKADAVALAAFATLLSLLLWPAWTHNPDLTHGLLMPLVFVLLIRESRASGPPRYLRPGTGGLACSLCLSIAGLSLLAAGGLYAASITWSNGMVLFLLALALSCLLGAGLATFADDRVRLLPCNWCAWIALGLWPLSAPIPPGTYSRLTLGLQLWISSGVMDVLQLFGVAARRHGNIIELATGSVGVAEACSGVRSLVSCIFVGLFFSASLVRNRWGRAVVIVAAAPLALAMNFIRALALTLLANGGVDISGFWHDATGFAVLGLTAALLAGLAVGLGRSSPEEPSVAAAAPSPASPAAFRPSEGLLAAALALAAILAGFYAFNTFRSVRRDLPAPDLAALFPAAPPGWSATTAGDLGQFASTLQTHFLFQRTYRGGGEDDPPEITLYIAYWRPGQASVSFVDAHTPDACWPAAGWLELATPRPRLGPAVAGRLLAPSEFREFTNAGSRQYVWFWHLYDGRSIPYQNPFSLRELASTAWHYGFRHDGDQCFVSVASNRPWDAIAGQPVLREFFERTRPLGL